MNKRLKEVAVAALSVGMMASATAASAEEAYPYEGIVELASPHDFEAMWERLPEVVEANGMIVVSRASASRAAAGRDVDIPGNAVIGVYRNDFAVRMLAASIPAGIEAPLRYYITENEDGSTTLTYRQPSAVFAPYGSDDLDAMAAELDTIFSSIAEDAVAAD